jgi:flagellar biosynthesis GTPase FlhF
MAEIGVLIAFSLGSAVAKYIIKSWINSDLLDEVADELIDLIKDSGKYTAEQRRRQNDVDKLAVAAASRMRQVYDFSVLPENSKQSIALEVARTLNKVNVDAEYIVSLRMDSKKLANRLLQSQPNATKLFSSDETELYKRLIYEAAEAQVQISGLLGSFTTVFATKLLQDNERLISMVERLLCEPDETAKHFLNRYKEAIRNRLDRLEVFGLPKLDRYSRQQSLSVAYISLDAEPRSLDVEFSKSLYEQFEATAPYFKTNKDTLSLGALNSIMRVTCEDQSADDQNESFITLSPEHELRQSINFIARRSNSIESVLGDKRRVIVQGQAGSGKTTLLLWLAVRAASGDFKPPLSSWNRSVPFFIRLREYVDKDFPAPQDFLEKVTPMITEEMPKGWVHDILDSGLGLVLVDGVDELPSDRRNAMLARLAELVHTFPASRYIVSSRPPALKEQLWPQWKEWVETEGFVTTSLHDMDSLLVATFIDQWHSALAASINDVDEQKKINAHAPNLKSLLNGRPPLRRLAKNPLLCAMICALYQERLQNLPNERLTLYQDCVEMLLTRREEGRKISTYDYPTVNLSQKLAFIQDLAYRMIINGYSYVENNYVDNRFDQKIPALGLTGITGDGVRRLFVDRTNLLREPIIGRIDFTHLTFQEYLAAREIVEQGDFGLLEEHIGNDSWREVIVLAIGSARQKERENLLGIILNESYSEIIPLAKRKQIALLALACLETSIALDPTLRDKILQNAAIAIPPTDEDEAKLVASAGDPAIQLLEPKEAYSEEQIISCIETLAMIGSKNAMHQLVKFACDLRQPVRQALVAAWDNFDRDQYAQIVLVSLEEITIIHSSRLRGIKHLRNLISLNLLLKVSPEKDEYLELSMLPNLAEISIHLTSIRSTLKKQDISFLVSIFSPIKSLRKLNFNLLFRKIDDLSCFAQLTQLTHLKIHAEFDSTSFEPLSHLTNLIELSIGTYRGSPPDCEPFRLLTNLRRLTISTHKTDLDLRTIEGITQLTALSIRSRIVPKSLKSLAKLSNLVELSIPVHNDYVDLTFLSGLVKLSALALELGRNPDFEQIVPMTSLRILKIVSQKSLDIGSISKLTQLSHLDLSQCQITDITPIAALTNLTHLKLPPNHNFNLQIFQQCDKLEIETSAPRESGTPSSGVWKRINIFMRSLDNMPDPDGLIKHDDD